WLLNLKIAIILNNYVSTAPYNVQNLQAPNEYILLMGYKTLANLIISL
ncbi:8014_t:CDS:2, partial [Funneliformis caledonium]